MHGENGRQAARRQGLEELVAATSILCFQPPGVLLSHRRATLTAAPGLCATLHDGCATKGPCSQALSQVQWESGGPWDLCPPSNSLVIPSTTSLVGEGLKRCLFPMEGPQ